MPPTSYSSASSVSSFSSAPPVVFVSCQCLKLSNGQIVVFPSLQPGICYPQCRPWCEPPSLKVISTGTYFCVLWQYSWNSWKCEKTWSNLSKTIPIHFRKQTRLTWRRPTDLVTVIKLPFTSMPVEQHAPFFWLLQLSSLSSPSTTKERCTETDWRKETDKTMNWFWRFDSWF